MQRGSTMELMRMGSKYNTKDRKRSAPDLSPAQQVSLWLWRGFKLQEKTSPSDQMDRSGHDMPSNQTLCYAGHYFLHCLTRIRLLVLTKPQHSGT